MRGMKMGLAKGAVFIGALLGVSAAAMAAAGFTRTDVVPISDPVTYGISATQPGGPQTFFIGYEVTIRNQDGNTINNVVFEGTINVTPGNQTLLFRPDLAVGLPAGGSCDFAPYPTGARPTTEAPIAGAATIRCTIGQIKGLEVLNKFAIFFEAPTKTANTPDDSVNFRGRTITAEGANAGNSPNDSVDYWPLNDNTDFNVTPSKPVPPATCPGSWFDVDSSLSTDTSHNCLQVNLGTANPNRVKSAVPAAGGTFYTGTGVAKSYPNEDSWVTQVKIPARTATYTSAEVNETVTAGGLAANLLTKNTTILDIPGTFTRLEITLIRDASTIVKGAKVNTAKIYYSEPRNPDSRVTYPYEVLPCTDTTYGALPQAGIPCVKSRTEFTRKTAPTPDWEGDWLFLIWAIDNGRYDN